METIVLMQSAPEFPDPLLAAADRLFYRHGVQAVGMDALRAEAGLPLRRMYRLYPSKDALVSAYLESRDQRWRAWLRGRVAELADEPLGQVLAVFDALEEWFASDEFRGCAFINATAELDASAPSVRAQAESHKRAVRDDLTGRLQLAGFDRDAGDIAAHLMVLIDGATVQAGLGVDGDAAMRAKRLAERLIGEVPSSRTSET